MKEFLFFSCYHENYQNYRDEALILIIFIYYISRFKNE